MSVSITIPDTYGYVILACLVAPTVTITVMNFGVGSARNKYQVKYPNLYATPGFHKEAEAFNRVQRGNQCVSLEAYPFFLVTSLLAGIVYPMSMVVTGIVWCIGAFTFQLGYADMSLDVETARYKKGGMLFRLADASVFVSAILIAAEISGWYNGGHFSQ